MYRCRQTLRACTAAWCAVFLHAAPVVAADGPPPPVASHEIGDDEDAVLASAAWNELLRQLREHALDPVDEASLRTACRFGFMLPRPTGWTSTDVCLYMALRSLGRQSGSQTGYLVTAARTAQRTGGPVGIGLELGGKRPGGLLHIVSAFHGSTGERAGILPGDRIERIDGHDIVPLTMQQTIDIFKGSEGSVVRVDVVRGPRDERLSITARRERFVLPTVWQEAVGPKVAAVRLSRFGAGTPDEVARWTDTVVHTTSPAPGALLLDLRGNTGGILEAATQVSGLFASDGVVVGYLRKRGGEEAMTPKPVAGLSPTARDWLLHVRIAVLVDGHTGSAAEALALFLREQRNARIFGAPTSGHAEVLQHFSLEGAGVVDFQDGELLSSRHVAWAAAGIAPDIAAAAPPPRDYALPDDTAFVAACQSLEQSQ
jgi:C-terminal peptidase prc